MEETEIKPNNFEEFLAYLRKHVRWYLSDKDIESLEEAYKTLTENGGEVFVSGENKIRQVKKNGN